MGLPPAPHAALADGDARGGTPVGAAFADSTDGLSNRFQE